MLNTVFELTVDAIRDPTMRSVQSPVMPVVSERIGMRIPSDRFFGALGFRSNRISHTTGTNRKRRYAAIVASAGTMF